MTNRPFPIETLSSFLSIILFAEPGVSIPLQGCRQCQIQVREPPSSVKSIFQPKVVSSGTKLRLIRPQLPPPVNLAAALTVRPCQVRSRLLHLSEHGSLLRELLEEATSVEGGKPTVHRLRANQRQPVPAVELARRPNCGQRWRSGSGQGRPRCNGARCSLARESPSRPSAQRSPIPPPSSAPAGTRAHCQFTDDKPFRVNSRRTARQPRWCFRASELSRPASSRVEKGSEANQAELHQLFNGKMNNKPIKQG